MDPNTLAMLVQQFGGSGGAAAAGGGAAGAGAGGGMAGMGGGGGMPGGMPMPGPDAKSGGPTGSILGFVQNAGKIKSARAANPFTGQGGANAVGTDGKGINARTGAPAGGAPRAQFAPAAQSPEEDVGSSLGDFAKKLLRKRETAPAT